MEHAIYLKGIKSALNARGETYADLAKQLKMTESGVKKMMNAKDISFRRILQICETLNILPGQLFTLSERSSIPEVLLSAEQEEALLRDRKLLILYWRFTIEKINIIQICKQHGWTIQDLTRGMQKLVSLGLISQRKGQFQIKHKGKFRWSNESKLAKYLNKEWSKLVLKRSLEGGGRSSHRLSTLKLSVETFKEVQLRLSRVLDEAVQASEREELSTPQGELKDCLILTCMLEGSVFEI